MVNYDKIGGGGERGDDVFMRMSCGYCKKGCTVHKEYEIDNELPCGTAQVHKVVQYCKKLPVHELGLKAPFHWHQWKIDLKPKCAPLWMFSADLPFPDAVTWKQLLHSKCHPFVKKKWIYIPLSDSPGKLCALDYLCNKSEDSKSWGSTLIIEIQFLTQSREQTL